MYQYHTPLKTTKPQRPVSHIPLARRVDEFGSDYYGNATTSLQYCDVFQ